MAKNFSYSLVATAPSPATTGTSLVVTAADGTLFPPAPFQATIWPTASQPTAANAEIVTVTGVSTDTLTIVRAQEGSTARTVIIGDQIAATVTAGVIVQSSRYNPITAALQDIVLDRSTDFTVADTLEIGAANTLEIPATSTLEIVPTVKQAEVQSYFGLYDFIESGCVWSADAAASTLLATMTDGYVWINGRRLRVNSVRSRAFTASKDTYVDFSDNGDGTAKLTYTENTNNLSTGAPTLAAGSLRNAIIISGATNIAASTSINQGQETIILPIVSSIAYSVTDNLGNLICPRDPFRRVLGHRMITAAQTNATTTYADITGLNLTVNIPAGRKVIVTGQIAAGFSTVDGDGGAMNLFDVTSAVQIIEADASAGMINGTIFVSPSQLYTPPASGARNFKAQFKAVTGGTYSTNSAATLPSWIKVEIA